MKAQMHIDPWWAALTVWGVVNAVNILQAAGFISRVYTQSLEVNHILGYVMMALAVPTALALVAFGRAHLQSVAWRHRRTRPLLYGDGNRSGQFQRMERHLIFTSVRESSFMMGGES